MTKTIQQVGEMVGIPAKETDKILEAVMANTAKLDACTGPHDFSIALDRHTKQPLENPTPQQAFGCRWQCSKCGGHVDGINRSWYNRGLKDGGCLWPTREGLNVAFELGYKCSEKGMNIEEAFRRLNEHEKADDVEREKRINQMIVRQGEL